MTETPAPTPPARRSHIPPWAQALVAVLGSGSVILALVMLGLTNASLQSQITALSQSLTAANDQVVQLGAKPVAPEPEKITGQPGAAGPAGAAGKDGVSVLSVSCSSSGTFTVVYSSGRTQTGIGDCIAQDGAAGANGANGANGADGSPGATGATGADGQPPVSWTYTDGVGFNYLCTRTDPFDAAQPTYSCSRD